MDKKYQVFVVLHLKILRRAVKSTRGNIGYGMYSELYGIFSAGDKKQFEYIRIRLTSDYMIIISANAYGV